MQYCAADDQQFSDANVHRYFFTCVSRLFQQLANTDTKETLTARILGQYRGFLQVLSPTISFFDQLCMRVHQLLWMVLCRNREESKMDPHRRRSYCTHNAFSVYRMDI
jgi:hypothetical protein